MSPIWKPAALAAALALAAGAAAAQETPTLTLAAQKFGTVNWELDVIEWNGLDRANGFDLEVMDVADNAAGRIAFEGDAADAIVSDWVWVARQRAAGRDYVMIPYSTSVGGVMVPAGSGAKTLADLAGGEIGIAGGPLDKSWLILRAYAEQAHGMDLAAETEQVFGAPPLIFKTAVDGELAGAVNYWHYMAKMKAAGMRELVSVADAAAALGLDPDTPLLGYVVKGETIAANPDLVAGLAAASRRAKEILATDEAEWDRLRPLMNVETDAEFEALKAGYREGIPSGEPIDLDAAARMLALMAELGGEELVGEAETLPDGVFYAPNG